MKDFTRVVLAVNETRVMNDLRGLLRIKGNSLIQLNSNKRFVNGRRRYSKYTVFRCQYVNALRRRNSACTEEGVCGVYLQFQERLSVLFSFSSLRFIVLLLHSSLLTVPISRFLRSGLLRMSNG